MLKVMILCHQKGQNVVIPHFVFTSNPLSYHLREKKNFWSIPLCQVTSTSDIIIKTFSFILLGLVLMLPLYELSQKCIMVGFFIG